MIFLRKAFRLLLLHALLLPAPGCRWAAPDPQAIAPPPVPHFEETELRAIVLPQHIPASPSPAPADTEPQFFVHTITKQGETLIAIARWYTGNSANWKKLAEVNEETDPRRICIGDTIRIPSNLLITRDPLPQNALAAGHRPNVSPRPAQPPPAVAPPPLFGPIETAPTPAPDEKSALPRQLQRLDE